jgi:ubiquinone/menaquinone biosynthesis C-methylase UbiE
MFFRRLLARQLARPSGVPGLFMARTLDRVNERVNRLALEQLALAPRDRLLDVGFGGGLLIRQALAAVPEVRVTGIDVSLPMLDRARRTFRQAIDSGRVEIAEADVCSMPFASHSFDKAAAINTLHFWPEPGAGLAEVRRVLKPGGMLVIAVRPREFLERVKFTELGFRAFEDGELHRLLEAAGFESSVIEHHSDRDMGTVQVIARNGGARAAQAG